MLFIWSIGVMEEDALRIALLEVRKNSMFHNHYAFRGLLFIVFSMLHYSNTPILPKKISI